MTCATGCKCEKPDNGETIFCDRHQVEKSLALWERCCERTKWWRSWEERRGPGQVAPPEGTSRQTRSGGGCGKKPVNALVSGPGTELKRLLKRISILGTGGCGCNAMATKMDIWGPAGCREPEHRAEILDHMQKEAAKRKLPFVRTAADGLVEFAIRKAEWGSRPGIPLQNRPGR